jgi:hypothetical protein
MSNFRVQIMKNLKQHLAQSEFIFKPWWQRSTPLLPNVKYNWPIDDNTPNVPDVCLFFGLPYTNPPTCKKPKNNSDASEDGTWVEVADYYIKSEPRFEKYEEEEENRESNLIIGQAHNY